jgi:transposase
MSLPAFSLQSALFSTVALTGQFFGPTDRYRLFAQKIYPLLAQARSSVARAYCQDNGRRALEPVCLLGVSLLQYLEGVPDRQAVEMLRYHAGWNFALNRVLGQEVFHPTALVYFRERLLKHELSSLVFAQILEGLVKAGLVEQRTPQRLDSTQVFGLIARMSRLEIVRETLRLALQELQESAAAFGKPGWWTLLWERYVSSKLDYRTEASVLRLKMEQAGADGAQLIQWVKSLSDSKVFTGSQMQLLVRVFEENFTQAEGQPMESRPAQPAGAVQNPHDSEAQWAAKGQGKARKEHVGYKVQVAESVSAQPLAPGEPTRSFLTGILTQPAIASDEAGAQAMEREQAQMGLEKPSELYVDGAYISAQKLAEVQAQGRDLIGPAQAGKSPENRFGVEEFEVRVEQRQAICPAGKPNTQCSRLEEEARGKVNYRFEWSTHCAECPLRERCVGPGQKHRSLVVGEHHSTLQQRRREQRTEAFKLKSQRRNAIEGTHSELVRAHGLRQARYRGLKKVRLQNYFAGAACNAKRWIRRMVWELKRGHASLEPAVPSG